MLDRICPAFVLYIRRVLSVWWCTNKNANIMGNLQQGGECQTMSRKLLAGIWQTALWGTSGGSRMHEWNVKGARRKRQDFGIKRDSEPDMRQKQMSAGVFLKTGQPNMFQTAQRREELGLPNRTGLPDTLKAGIENLSGISMDDVRVHYNSPKPAQLQALAYTKGTEIHVAPGQAKHLPHEAWHVVQQKQGRVMPTMKFGGNFINDNPVLEREADFMGAKAVQGKFKDGALSDKNVASACVQRLMPYADDFKDTYNVKRYYCYVDRESTMDMKKPLVAENKVKALQKISEEAARIGKIVWGSRMNDYEFFYAVIRAEYYAKSKSRKESKINGYKEQIEELDDNIYAENYVKEGYREEWEEDIKNLEDEIAGIKPVKLSLKYQFRKEGVKGAEIGGPGYIVSVEKTRKTKRNAVGKMTNFESFNPEKKYSNRHESTKGKILEHTYKNSNEEGRRADVRSKNFDAYTKLAGEGARFRCVRNNIAKITDDTVFYAAGQTEGVKFSELWKTWSVSFQRKYDIEDSEIKGELQSTNGGKPVNTLWISQGRHTKAVPISGDSIELK